MPLALTVTKVNNNLRTKEIILKAVASGSYPTGGDTVDLTALLNPSYFSNAVFGYPGKIEEFAIEQAPAGYGAELIPGTALNNWKLKIFTTANTQLGAGAYPAAITGDQFYLSFAGPKGRI